MAWRIGIDIGGTFTDVALVEEATGRIEVAKVLTTPADFGQARDHRHPPGPGATTPSPRPTWRCWRMPPPW